MQKRLSLNRWILAVWLLLIGAAAYALPQATQSASWGCAPASNVVMANDVCPTYQFHTTSSYIATMDNSSSSSSVMRIGGRQMTDPFNPAPTDENAVGEVDDPTPVGSPLVLLIFAMLFAWYRYKKKRTV